MTNDEAPTLMDMINDGRVKVLTVDKPSIQTESDAEIPDRYRDAVDESAMLDGDRNSKYARTVTDRLREAKIEMERRGLSVAPTARRFGRRSS